MMMELSPKVTSFSIVSICLFDKGMSTLTVRYISSMNEQEQRRK